MILWTKSTGLLVRWPIMGPLLRHAFSNPINWRIQNISPIQAVPHTCPNTEGNPNGQVCEYRRITHNRHPNILKEPTINRGRHGQALEKLAQIFDNATENLETHQQNRAQTSSTPTTRAKIRATPRVHARVTRNHTRYNTNKTTNTNSKYGRWQRGFTLNSKFRGCPKE